MEEEYEKTLSDYLHIIIRRKYIIAITIIILMTASLIMSLMLPAIYKSEGTILIEQQNIPEELIKSTVTSFANNRIRKIQQKIMTTSNINNIIRKYKIYPKKQDYLRDSELVDLFKENTSLEFVDIETVNNKGRKVISTIAFTLSFNHKNKYISQNVVNDLIKSFLNENSKIRIDTTKETSKFLESVSANIKSEITKIEKNIAAYKGRYSDSLPDLLPTNLSTISRIETSIQQLSLQKNILIERKISLQNQVYSNDSTTNLSTDSLEFLKQEYSKLLGKYSTSHPDVKDIKRKIKSFSTGLANKTNPSMPTPAYSQSERELRLVNIELGNIFTASKNLKAKLNKLEASVSQTHQVEQGYYELVEDLESKKEKYKELRGKYLEAKLSQLLEEEKQSEQFSILESASLPSKPYKPNRIKILFIGFILSILGGIFIGFIVENIDRNIRGYQVLEPIIGMDPIVVIPYIENEEDKEISRKNRVNFIIFIGIIFLISIIAINFLYMRIDLISEKLLDFISML